MSTNPKKMGIQRNPSLSLIEGCLELSSLERWPDRELGGCNRSGRTAVTNARPAIHDIPY